MEKKNNNGVLIGLLLGIIVMLLIFVALFATNTISFKSKETPISKQTKENSRQSIEKEENKEEQKKDNREEIIAKLKEKLTDEIWVKENLHSKKDCFNRDVDVPNHDLRFEVLKDKNNYPMVIIFDDAIDNWIVTTYKVYYDNGEVKAKNIFNEVKHPSHGGFGIDVNQNVVISIFSHMGDFSFQAYDVTEDEPKLYDEYKCSNCEYEYKGEKTYSTVETKELTIDNLNKYLK